MTDIRGGAERDLGIGIVGTGKISRQFAEALRTTPGVSARSVYSRKDETGKLYAKECGVPSSTDSWEGFLSDPAIDAVYVATPNVAHFGQALDALKAGPANVDAISESTGVAPSVVISTMIGLEILHRVRKNPDGTYSKKR